MKLKQIILILFALILLPVLFYTAYEFTVLSDTEVLITEIYERQLDAVLFSVNQYVLDLVQSWRTSLLQIIAENQECDNTVLQEFFQYNPSIYAFFMTDTTYSQDNFQICTAAEKNENNRQLILDMIKINQDRITRLSNQYQRGYNKIEPLQAGKSKGVPAEMKILTFVVETGPGNYKIGGFVIDTGQFLQRNVQPKLRDIAENEFILALKKDHSDSYLLSTDLINPGLTLQSKAMWLFPDYRISIAIRGTSAEALAKKQTRRSGLLIIGLDIILLFAVWFLYRSIRREMELARLKTDFVSNVSHELRTPLALIRMFAETMELGRVKTEEKAKEYVTIIRRESERLSQIINKILDFSKIEFNKKQYNLAPIDLNAVVSETLDFYKFHLESNGFDLETSLSNEQLQVKADAEAVKEALINLLDNASKYSTAEKSISVQTGMDSSGCYLAVSDRGIGIPVTEQEKIFDKFYRIRDDNTMGRPGSGLGLALIKYIMDAHGGKVICVSEPGNGSTFTLLFPFNREPL